MIKLIQAEKLNWVVENTNPGLLTPKPFHFPGHHSVSLWIIILNTYKISWGFYYSANTLNFRNSFTGVNGKLEAEERMKVNGNFMFCDPVQLGLGPFDCFTHVITFFRAVFEKEEVLYS